MADTIGTFFAFDKEVKLVDINEVLSKCVQEGASWEQVERVFTAVLTKNIMCFKALTSLADYIDSPNGGSYFDCSLGFEVIDDEYHFNPIIYAIKTDNEELFDLIAKHYPHESLNDTLMLEAAVLTHEGKYLERVENVCQENKMDDYFRNNQDNLFNIFDTHCRRMRLNRTKENYDMAIKLFDLCPNAAGYQDAQKRSFLRSAVENTLEDVTASLLKRKCDATITIDEHNTQTLYDFAFIKAKHHAMDCRWQDIIQLLRESIPADKKQFWKEKEKYLTEKDNKSIKSTRILIGQMVAITAVAGLFLAKCEPIRAIFSSDKPVPQQKDETPSVSGSKVTTDKKAQTRYLSAKEYMHE